MTPAASWDTAGVSVRLAPGRVGDRAARLQQRPRRHKDGLMPGEEVRVALEIEANLKP